MADVVIAPVVPPVVLAGRGKPGGRSDGGLRRRPLPLPDLPTPRAGTLVYGVAALDASGRIADSGVVRALGWVPGTRLHIHEGAGLVLLRADRQGVFTVTGQGHLRLPAAVRQWCGLAVGDRVLLAACPADGLLVVHPPAAVDAMVVLCAHAYLAVTAAQAKKGAPNPMTASFPLPSARSAVSWHT